MSWQMVWVIDALIKWSNYTLAYQMDPSGYRPDRIPFPNILAAYLLIMVDMKKKRALIMEPDFAHIEKDLALGAWIMYAFKIYDMLLEEDFDFDGWMKADIRWFEPN